MAPLRARAHLHRAFLAGAARRGTARRVSAQRSGLQRPVSLSWCQSRLALIPVVILFSPSVPSVYFCCAPLTGRDALSLFNGEKKTRVGASSPKFGAWSLCWAGPARGEAPVPGALVGAGDARCAADAPTFPYHGKPGLLLLHTDTLTALPLCCAPAKNNGSDRR